MSDQLEQFGHVFGFELKYRLRQPAFYVFSALFFFLTFTATSTDSVQIGGGIGNVARNAPYIIARTVNAMGLFTVILITIFMSTVVSRDKDLGVREILYSTPLKKFPLLMGRFTATTLLAVISASFSALGLLVASLMPYQTPEHIQAFSVVPYLYTLFVMVLPNCLMAGALFFSISILTGRAMATYVAMIALFALYGFAFAFLGDLQNENLAVLLDPFGLASLDLQTRYWTIVERNTLLPPLTGTVLLTRVLWLALAGLLMVITFFRFRMDLGASKGRAAVSSDPGDSGQVRDPGALNAAGRAIPALSPTFQFRTTLGQWLSLAHLETRTLLRSLPFLVLMLFGLLNLVGNISSEANGRFLYPVTHRMLSTIAGGFDLFLLIVIVFYSAELVWREKKHRFHEIQGSLPVPSWIFLTSKFAALTVLILVSLTLAMGLTMGFQLSKGFHHLEPGLYLRGLFVMSFSEWLLLAVIAVFTQVIGRQRYLGFFLMMLYFLVNTFGPELGIEHHLFFYRGTPAIIYSDMNGYGHFAAAALWFKLFWGLLAIIMLTVAVRLWPRGSQDSLWPALRNLPSRWRPVHSGIVTTAGLGFIACGAFIYYNTNILNDFKPNDDDERVQAHYESQFKTYQENPSPRVTAVVAEVDFHPEQRRLDIRGTFDLVNRTDQFIEELYLNINPLQELRSLDLDDRELTEPTRWDRESGFRVYRLTEAVAPGRTVKLGFDLGADLDGFVNNGANAEIVANGSFIDNLTYFPRIGYLSDRELTVPTDRRKQGLDPEWSMPSLDDPENLMTTFISDADHITFEAVVSTSAGQTAIAPGKLQSQWEQEGRRYFSYRVDEPILNFYAFLSGRYEVMREQWNGVDLEVFYHEDHAVNVPRMLESMHATLDYCTSSFSPYPHKQLRIVEFPRYRRFAQAFPGTVPFSESSDFISDLRDTDNIDMVFYITAHEIAHQWWGHQLIPANVPGSSMITESLAQYTALMVMEKDLGPSRVGKFLQYEQMNYLRGRGAERDEELPLSREEGQSYIYYRKGSLAFYALRDYLGEDVVNDALREFLNAHLGQAPPYATAPDLLERLEQRTPPQYAYLIEDLFQTITLYDNRTEAVTSTRTENGRYRVVVDYVSRKYRADGQGVEEEVPHRDWIELGVFGEDADGQEVELCREKRQLTSGEGRLEVLVDQEPKRAGIDPRNLLIDRVVGDNSKDVSMEAGQKPRSTTS